MKSSLLTKLSIMAIAIAALTGCPALTNLMELMSGKSQGPQKTLEITGIPPEYDGYSVTVIASVPTDSLGKNACMSGGMIGTETMGKVMEGTAKTLIQKVNAQSANTLSAIKHAMGNAEACDGEGRIVSLAFASYAHKEMDTANFDAAKFQDSIMKKSFENTFIYTKGINICDMAKEGKEVQVSDYIYSFSGTESTLDFKDFMRASDCEMLAEVLGLQGEEGSEEYIVKEDAPYKKNPLSSLPDENVKIDKCTIVNVTNKYDYYLYFDNKGWVDKKYLLRYDVENKDGDINLAMSIGCANGTYVVKEDAPYKKNPLSSLPDENVKIDKCTIVNVTNANYPYLYFDNKGWIDKKYLTQNFKDFMQNSDCKKFVELNSKNHTVEIPSDKGTSITYEGYHKITKVGTDEYKLKEDAKKNGRYSTKEPEYYARIDNRIAIATKRKIGEELEVSIGDYVYVEFLTKDGNKNIYECIIGDEKYEGALDNNWGHDNGRSVVEIIYHDYDPPNGYSAIINDPWGEGKVTRITKLGNYYNSSN